ncbi:hypothetical protein ACS0TY_034134 [Phlomoides rotata]
MNYCSRFKTQNLILQNKRKTLANLTSLSLASRLPLPLPLPLPLLISSPPRLRPTWTSAAQPLPPTLTESLPTTRTANPSSPAAAAPPSAPATGPPPDAQPSILSSLIADFTRISQEDLTYSARIPEARDRISRHGDIFASYINRRRIRSINGGGTSSEFFVLQDDADEQATGTPFRWRDTPMVGTPGLIRVPFGRGSFGSPRFRGSSNFGRSSRLIRGRENMSPALGSGRARRVLP